MKFGKTLRATAEGAGPEWSPMFMNYKDLKRCIAAGLEAEAASSAEELVGVAERGKGGAEGTAEERTGKVREAVRGDSGFFDILKQEVDKVNEFFLDKQEDFIIEHRQLSERVSDGRGVTRAEWARLRSRVDHFHKQLVLLEQYSSVNYTGFRKILKKHDKKTGLSMRNVYLKTVLITPFFLSDTVRKMILSSEAMLEQLAAMSKFRRGDDAPVPPQLAAAPSSGPPLAVPFSQRVPITTMLSPPQQQLQGMAVPRPHALISPVSAMWRLYRDVRDYATGVAGEAHLPNNFPQPPQALIDLVDLVSPVELGLDQTFLSAVKQQSNYVIAHESTFSIGFFVFGPGTKLQLFAPARQNAIVSRLLNGRARLRTFSSAEPLPTEEESLSDETAATDNGSMVMESAGEGSAGQTAVSSFSAKEMRNGIATGPWPAVSTHPQHSHVEWDADTVCALFYVFCPALTDDALPHYTVNALGGHPPMFRFTHDRDNSQSFARVPC